MAWTAQMFKVSGKDTQNPVAEVSFTDGVQKPIHEVFPLAGLTADTFRARVESVRARHEEASTFLEVVDESFSLTPVKPPDPSPEELARGKYFMDVSILSSLRTLVNLGVLQDTDKLVADHLALVASEFLPSYVGLP